MLNQLYEDYCYYRLPCGICILTNSQCPKIPDFEKIDINVPKSGDTVTARTYSTKLGDITTEVHCQ